MVQFLSIIFFLGFLQFLLGFSKVPVFFVSPCINFMSDFLCTHKRNNTGTFSCISVNRHTLLPFSVQKMEAACPAEILVPTFQTTPFHEPEDHSPSSHHSENLQSSSSSSFGTTTLCGFSLSQPSLSKFFYP